MIGNTKIPLLDGREVQIKDLVGREFIVYSYDLESNQIVPGRAHNCCITMKNAPVGEVFLYGGGRFIHSILSDRKVLLSNGRYKEARDLLPGHSLMPVTPGESRIDYEVLRLTFRDHEDVYDFTVGNYHNFAISPGVFVQDSERRSAPQMTDVHKGR